MMILVEGIAYVESPYLLSRHELVSGGRHTLFSIAGPSGVVNKVKNSFEKRFSELRMWMVDGFENVYSFDFYGAEAHDWNINWTVWSNYLGDLVSGACDTVSSLKERVITNKKETVTPDKENGVTAEDLRLIVSLLERLDTPLETLSQKFGYSIGGVARAKNSLLERGIIEACLSIDHIGLNEHILLLIESDVDTLYSFVVAIRRLPKAWVYWMRSPRGTSSLACWLKAPPGSITPLERVIRWTLRPLAEYKLFFRSILEGSRGLLLKLFDPQTGTWRMEPEIKIKRKRKSK